MKTYSYKDKHGRVLAESDSPIIFNEKLFPIFKDLEPVVNEKVKKTNLKSTEQNKVEEK